MRDRTSTAHRPVEVNNFLNSYTLIQTATDASFFAIMAVGATVVIISGGIDLSVGSIYALAGVTHGAWCCARIGPLHGAGDGRDRAARLASASGSPAARSTALMVVGPRVHPFIITLGTMWILRGIAFVASNAESILLPRGADAASPRRRSGLATSLYPVPMLSMLAVTALGAIYLRRP